MKRLVVVTLLSALTSCSWWQVATILAEVVEELPPDSIVEEFVEEVVEDYFEMDEGSLDFSPGTTEK